MCQWASDWRHSPRTTYHRRSTSHSPAAVIAEMICEHFSRAQSLYRFRYRYSAQRHLYTLSRRLYRYQVAARFIGSHIHTHSPTGPMGFACQAAYNRDKSVQRALKVWVYIIDIVPTRSEVGFRLWSQHLRVRNSRQQSKMLTGYLCTHVLMAEVQNTIKIRFL